MMFLQIFMCFLVATVAVTETPGSELAKQKLVETFAAIQDAHPDSTMSFVPLLLGGTKRKRNETKLTTVEGVIQSVKKALETASNKPTHAASNRRPRGIIEVYDQIGWAGAGYFCPPGDFAQEQATALTQYINAYLQRAEQDQMVKALKELKAAHEKAEAKKAAEARVRLGSIKTASTVSSQEAKVPLNVSNLSPGHDHTNSQNPLAEAAAKKKAEQEKKAAAKKKKEEAASTSKSEICAPSGPSCPAEQAASRTSCQAQSDKIERANCPTEATSPEDELRAAFAKIYNTRRQKVRSPICLQFCDSHSAKSTRVRTSSPAPCRNATMVTSLDGVIKCVTNALKKENIVNADVKATGGTRIGNRNDWESFPDCALWEPFPRSVLVQDSGLPLGWEAVDKKGATVYRYYETKGKDGVSVPWKPTGSKRKRIQRKETPDRPRIKDTVLAFHFINALPSGWVPMVLKQPGHEHDGKTFYYNTETKEGTWKMPVAPHQFNLTDFKVGDKVDCEYNYHKKRFKESATIEAIRDPKDKYGNQKPIKLRWGHRDNWKGWLPPGWKWHRESTREWHQPDKTCPTIINYFTEKVPEYWTHHEKLLSNGFEKEYPEKPEHWYDLKCVSHEEFREKQAKALARFIESKLHYLKIEKAFAEFNAPSIKFQIDDEEKSVTTGSDVALLVTNTLENALDKKGNLRKPAYIKVEFFGCGKVGVFDSEDNLIATFYFKGKYKHFGKQTRALRDFINARYGTEITDNPKLQFPTPVRANIIPANQKEVEKVENAFAKNDPILETFRRRRLGHYSEHHPKFVKLCEDIVAAHRQ